MLNRWVEGNLLNFCDKNGIGVIAFCPLFQGLLTDKYLDCIPEVSRARIQDSPLRKNEISEQNIRVIEELNNLAEKRGQTLAQMALAWVLRTDQVTSALMGASSVNQIKNNLEAVRNLTFSADEEEKIDRIVAKINLPKSLWASEA